MNYNPNNQTIFQAVEEYLRNKYHNATKNAPNVSTGQEEQKEPFINLNYHKRYLNLNDNKDPKRTEYEEDFKKQITDNNNNINNNFQL